MGGEGGGVPVQDLAIEGDANQAHRVGHPKSCPVLSQLSVKRTEEQEMLNCLGSCLTNARGISS